MDTSKNAEHDPANTTIMATEFDTARAVADPANAALLVLEIMRENNCGAKLSFEAFIAGTIAHHLGLVGSDFSDAEILRAVDSYKRRSSHLFYSEPESGFVAERTFKPVADVPKRRRPRAWKRRRR